MTTRNGARVWAAIADGRVVGFIAGALDVAALMRGLLRPKSALPLGLSAFRAVLRPTVLRKSLSVVRYAFRGGTKDSSAHEPELLAIAVGPDARGSGVGRALVVELERWLRDERASGYRVATNVAEETSNAFYRKLGFTPIAQVPHHALVLQVYRKALVPE